MFKSYQHLPHLNDLLTKQQLAYPKTLTSKKVH